jgi:prevent-host-death family protein
MVSDHGKVPGVDEIRMQASTFKARCLALLDEVARSRTSVVVTKYGKPVARLVPLDADPSPTLGSVTLLAESDEDFLSTGEEWSAEH